MTKSLSLLRLSTQQKSSQILHYQGTFFRLYLWDGFCCIEVLLESKKTCAPHSCLYSPNVYNGGGKYFFFFFLKRAVFTRDTNTITTKLTNFPFPLNYYSNAVAGLSLTCTNTHTNTGSEVSLHMVSGLRTARRFAKFTSGCLSPCGQSLLVSPQWGINLTYNHPPVLPTHLNTLWSLSTVS